MLAIHPAKRGGNMAKAALRRGNGRYRTARTKREYPDLTPRPSNPTLPTRKRGSPMLATPFLASYAAPSGTRKVHIQFFAASRRDALRIARKKAGKGLLFGLALTGVESLTGVDRREMRRAA
jgi:hypothetical protein